MQDTSKDPIQAYIEKIDPRKAAQPPSKERKPSKKGNPNKEHVVFRSILSDQMNEASLNALVLSATEQLNATAAAMGRDQLSLQTDGSEWWRNSTGEHGNSVNPSRTHMGKRELFEMTYHNRVEWRKYVLKGIYGESNRTLPIAARSTQQLIARAGKVFLSVEPFVSAEAVNKATGNVSPVDEELATAGSRYFHHKAREANLKGEVGTAIDRAFVVGECVVKTRHESNFNYYRSSFSLLVDAAGKVVLGENGDYIIEGKDFFSLQMLPVEEGGVAEVDTSLPPVLDRDGKTPFIPGHHFEWREDVLRKHTTYEGPSSEIVPMRDFICGPYEKDIHSAQFIAQYISVSPFDIVNTFGGEELASLAGQERLDTTVEYIKLLTEFASDGTNAKTYAETARPELGESNASTIPQAGNSRSEIAECYMEYDADGDGSPEQIFLVIDVKRSKLIYCDYLQNVTTDGRRPFDVVTVNRVDGRWHGIGMMEKLEHLQQSVDLWLNRASFASSSTGTSTFFNSSNVAEGDAWPEGGMPLPFNSGEVWHLKPGKTAADTLSYVTVPEVKMKEFLEFMSLNMQMASNVAGVLGTNDMQAAGLDSSNTATGVRDTSAKGDEMFDYYTKNLGAGITSVIQRWAGILFARMSEEEAYEWTEGETRLTDILRKTDAQRLKYFFRLTLTGGKNEQLNLAMDVAIPQVQAWSTQSSLMMQASLPLIETRLKALLIPNARAVLDSMVLAKKEEEAMMAAQAQAQAALPGPTL